MSRQRLVEEVRVDLLGVQAALDDLHAAGRRETGVLGLSTLVLVL